MEPRKLAVALLVFVLVAGAATARAEDRSKEDAIRELIEITGTTALAEQSMQQVVPMILQEIWEILKRAYPQAPDQLFAMMEKELVRAFNELMPEFVDGTIVIYAKYFTISEVDELIVFYRTDLGRKIIRVMPELMVETTNFGYRWGHNVVAPLAEERIRDKLRQKGYEL